MDHYCNESRALSDPVKLAFSKEDCDAALKKFDAAYPTIRAMSLAEFFRHVEDKRDIFPFEDSYPFDEEYH